MTSWDAGRGLAAAGRASKLSAPVGHSSTHAPQSMHCSWDILTMSSSIVRACTAHTATQSPHPVHLVASMSIPTGRIPFATGALSRRKMEVSRCGSGRGSSWLPRTHAESWRCQSSFCTLDSRAPSCSSMSASARDSCAARRCSQSHEASALESSRCIHPAPRSPRGSTRRRRRLPGPNASSSPTGGRSSASPPRRHNPRPRPVIGPVQAGPVRLNPGMA